MTADGTNKQDIIYRYYACTNARRKKGCNKRIENKEALEQTVIKRMIDFLSDEKTAYMMADYIVESNKSRTSDIEIKSLESRVQHTQGQIQATTDAFIQAVTIKNDLLMQNCDIKIKELNLLVKDLQSQITQMKLEQGAHHTITDIVGFIKDALKRSQDENDTEYHERLIQSIIDKVLVYDTHTEVWFTFGNGNQNSCIDIKDNDYLDHIIDQSKEKGTESSAPNTNGGERRI